MRIIGKALVIVAMLGSFYLGWFAHAQTRRPIMMTRIYTGSDGLSHAEEIEMKLNGNATEMIKQLPWSSAADLRTTPTSGTSVRGASS